MKNEFLKECNEIMQKPNVVTWYAKNLEDKPQKEFLKILCVAITKPDGLTVKEALVIAFITGLQWNIKFEGVP